MLRILTLSTLFPNENRPTLGIFIERQTRALAGLSGVEVEVVAPVGLPIWPLSSHPHFAPRAALPVEEQWNGLRVHRPRYRVWPRIGEARTARAMAAALLPLLSGIRARFPFDAIDAEFFWPDGPTAAILARELRVPLSIKARGSDIHYWGRRPRVAGQIRDAAAAADGLLAVSAAMKADMVRAGMSEEKIQVHHTGVDLNLFRPVDRAAAKAALGVTGSLIVCAGALIPSKGQALAIAALADIPGATLILVGDGPERQRLEALARPLRQRVRFLGLRPHGELPALLAAADVMLLPTASEGLANVWVESLACGTPVVTPDVGGAREVIDRPAAGRLAARDVEALAATVRAILADPPDPSEVRKSAERFSWTRNAQVLRRHLSGIAGRS
jgi:teichuronic acid biosynthesis glycosyltransferase TuaC